MIISDIIPARHVAAEEPRTMRTAIHALAAILTIGIATAAPAEAAMTCLKSRQIDDTKVIDSKTIDFRMKNGTIYRTTTYALAAQV